MYKINFTKVYGGYFYMNDGNKNYKIPFLSYKLDILYSIFRKYFHHTNNNKILDISIDSLISFDEMYSMLTSKDTTIFNMIIDIIKNTKIYDNQDNRNI